MKLTKKIIVANAALILFFFIYLCSLDLVFVLVFNQEKSILNNFVLLIIAMPFISVSLVLKLEGKDLPFKQLLITLIIFFVSLSVIAFLMFLWVATHFHTMIGGSI